MVKSADMAAKNWQSGFGSPQAQQKYKDSINAFNGNPMALAAAPDAEARYLAGVQRSLNNGKRNRALLAANPATWKQNSITVGAQRMVSGATKGAPKYAAAAQKLAPVWQQMHDAAHALPKGGLANAQARVAAALAVIMNAAGTA